MTAELLRSHTSMPVVEVGDGMALQANRVHVIPPNKYLSISGGTLHLSPPIERRGIRVPIDFFFRSLAEDQRERGIAIILSGSGSDGAQGVREIKAADGMVMVQEPDSLQFDGMPRSAINTRVVDYILPVEKMPETLCRYVQHWYANGWLQARPVPEEAAPNHLNNVVAFIRTRLKYDFSGYKKGTLLRRIQRRMGLHHIGDMGRYFELLRDGGDEVTALFKDMLISVTNFFREPEAWNELVHSVIKPLIANKKPDDTPIRIWVAGCATGEEAYSLAIVLLEELQEAERTCGIQIFASDIDLDALQFARAGVYPENIAADVSPERLRRFFIKGEHTYRINKEVRDAVVFAEQNLLGDAPFSKLDLISCRNVLIYLEPELQKKLMQLFHFALREGGCVFLGNAETINVQQQQLFEVLSRKWRIYRRLGPTPHTQLILPQTSTKPTADEPRKLLERLPANRMHNLAQQIVVQRYVPPAVLINRRGEVLYVYGTLDKYLQVPPGESASDIPSMVREGLRSKLQSAIRAATRNDQTINLRHIRVKRGKSFVAVRVTIEPLKHPREADGLFLVVFGDETADSPEQESPSRGEAIEVDGHIEISNESDTIIRHLEDELRTTREDLQSTIEELETSNEEFKASNEEVTSVNEELQSTNEELETSKEELQSLNEELNTVNNQLEEKVGELETANNDLSNLLANTDVPTVFLDREFRIKRYTPALTLLFRVIPADLGRTFSDLAQNFTDRDLLADADTVLAKLAPIQKEVRSSKGGWYIRRIVPYRTDDNRINGVVITFTDVTELKTAHVQLGHANEDLEKRVAERTQKLKEAHSQLQNDYERLREAGELRRQLAAIMQSTSAAIFNAQLNGVILNWNTGAERLYGYSASEAVGKNIAIILPEERKQDFTSMLELLRKNERVDDFETVRVHKDGRRVDVAVSAALLRDELGQALSLCEIGQNISDRKELQHQLAQSAELEQQRLGRELHDTLSQQIAGLGLLITSLHESLAHGTSPHAQIAARIEQGLEEAKAQIRSLSRGLLPVVVDAGELTVALHELAGKTTSAFGINCAFDASPDVPRVSPFQAAHLYRIAQEAVHNAVKHAEAKNIKITLHDSVGFSLNIEDDGIGIAPEKRQKPGMGMRIMHYRANLIGGLLTIEPTSSGTVVTCTIPNKGELP